VSTFFFTDLRLDNWVLSYDLLKVTRYRFVVCKVEVEDVVNFGTSRGNSLFFSKLSTTGVLPARSGQEEAREEGIEEAVVQSPLCNHGDTQENK